MSLTQTNIRISAGPKNEASNPRNQIQSMPPKQKVDQTAQKPSIVLTTLAQKSKQVPQKTEKKEMTLEEKKQERQSMR